MSDMKNFVKFGIILLVAVILSFLPAPEGLSSDAWKFFTLFVCVFIGLILEPLPSAFVVLFGVAIACILKIGPLPDPAGFVSSSVAIKWGLSGFSNTTVWLINIAFMFALGYEKTGLGKRIALALVSKMGKNTLGLGYAITMADLILAPFMPSNTARSGGTIFPIVKNIPILYGSTQDNEPRKIGAYISWVAIASTCVTSSMFYTALATNVLAKSLVEDIGILTPSWFQWFFYFLPVGVILILSVPLITYYIYPPSIKISKDIPDWARSELKEMGRISRNEIIMCILAGMALILWIFGNLIGIHATVSALAVLCLMVLFKIISWNDILQNKAAWNVFIWFEAMVTLAGRLHNVGFLDWSANKITNLVSSYPPAFILIILLLVFYFIHYLFASSTAHATALLALFLVAGSNIAGLNSPLLTLVLLYSLGLMGILTPYATGASPIWYGLGYIETKTYWKLGAIFGIIFIGVLIIVGIPWMKLWI